MARIGRKPRQEIFDGIKENLGRLDELKAAMMVTTCYVDNIPEFGLPTWK